MAFLRNNKEIIGKFVFHLFIITTIVISTKGESKPEDLISYSWDGNDASSESYTSIHLLDKREAIEKISKTTSAPKKATSKPGETYGPTKPTVGVDGFLKKLKQPANTSSTLQDQVSTSTPFPENDVTAPPNMTNKTDSHTYYNSSFITDPQQATTFWIDFDKLPAEHVVYHEMLSHSHRRADTVLLSFEFPFYGHLLRNITIATGGFLYTGDHLHNWLAATQYISPLMANFDTSLNNNSKILYADNGTAFTVFWKDVLLQDRVEDGAFSFQVTLMKSGDIIFAYDKVPISVTKINDQAHPVKVGLSDAYVIDRTVFYFQRKTIYEYHRVDFKKEEISNKTAIYFTAQPTCLSFKTCDDCMAANISFKCRWCETAQRCSDGFDRRRQDWFMNQCNQVPDDMVCSAITAPPATVKANTSSTIPSVLPASNTTVLSTASASSATITPSTVNTTSATEKLTKAPSTPSSIETISELSPAAKAAPNPLFADVTHGARVEEKTSSHGSAGGVIAVLVIVSLIGGIALWIVYAYKNPQSPSGQLLIKYRPNQWRWRHGEARYTAASSIHI